MKLSEFELELMQLLWQAGESTAPELHQQIIQRKQVTYSTVKTIIDRLQKKKAIARIKNYGRTIVYAPIVSQNTLHKPLLKNFIDKVFAGNSRPLLNHLLEDELLTQADIEYLKSVINKTEEL
ncbi:MAG: BlaI/MecI/CopY family transcriptional regulator [Proteobacteria bacterium]|nr:BlaI/MecI/CopY family transcriptional regulator [Pseudomonadota bacterium]